MSKVVKNQQEMSSVDSLQNLILNGWIPQASNKQNGDTHSVSSNTKNWEFRLCLKNVPKNYKETEIQKLYHVRSENVHFLKNNPDKQHDVQMAFVQFSSKRFVH